MTKAALFWFLLSACLIPVAGSAHSRCLVDEEDYSIPDYNLEFIEAVVGIYDGFVAERTGGRLEIADAYRCFFGRRNPPVGAWIRGVRARDGISGILHVRILSAVWNYPARHPEKIATVRTWAETFMIDQQRFMDIYYDFIHRIHPNTLVATSYHGGGPDKMSRWHFWFVENEFYHLLRHVAKANPFWDRVVVYDLRIKQEHFLLTKLCSMAICYDMINFDDPLERFPCGRSVPSGQYLQREDIPRNREIFNAKERRSLMDKYYFYDYQRPN